MQNEFLRLPIHVAIIGVDLPNGSFSVKQLNVYLGDIPDNVFEEINKLDTSNLQQQPKNKTIEGYFGPNWPKLLGFDEKHFSVSGGEDIFDVLPEDITVELPIEEKVEVEEKVPKIIFHRTSLYPEDRISEFREKIYLTTSIPIYRQHLFILLNDSAIPIRYKMMVEGNISIDIRRTFENSTGNKILDIPIDASLFQNREYVQIEALDYFTTLSDIYENFNNRHYYLVDVDEFVGPTKNLLREMSIADAYQFQLLYYGFIWKYWPIMTLDVFIAFIQNEGDLKNSYPDLTPVRDLLQTRYDDERKILDYKYELLEDAVSGYKKYPDFKKYRPELSTLSTKLKKEAGIIGVAIKSATLSSAEYNWSGDIASQTKVNIRNLFEQLSTNNDIPLVRVRLLVNGQIINLTKIKSPSLLESDPNDIQKVYEKIKYRLQMLYYNTILIAVRIPPKMVLEAADINIEKSDLENNYLIFSIYDNGKYNIKSIWDEEIQMDFRQIYHIVEKTINPIIERINQLGRAVFESVRKINPIKRTNTEFSSLHMSLFWKIPMTRSSFDKIGNLIKEDMSSQIIKPVEGLLEAVDQDSGAYNYYMTKGITEYDLNQFERSVVTNNYYEYLSNIRVKQKWVSLFEKGRLVNISHRTADVKIEIQGLREKEFTNFYQYIISFLYRVEKQILVSKTVEKSRKLDVSASNILKLSKSRDPEMFIFKRFGSDVVYSRICQKGHQPIPYLPEEYKLLDDKTKKEAVQYWNFTTKSPMFYVCPNKKYPYLNFLVGYHPKGYCLPCCKKTPPYEYELSAKQKTEKKGEEEEHKTTKKEHIYNICMQTHVYTEQDTQGGPSRYIMNYGKSIDIGRIGKLPDIIDRYLLYNLEDKDILTNQIQTFTWEGKDYQTAAIWKATKNNKVFEEPVAELKNILNEPYWSTDDGTLISPLQIVEDPNKSPDHYNRISNADLSFPIILYKFHSPADGTEKIKILEGKHRLAKAVLNKEEKIKVKYITRKQLEKIVSPSVSEEKDKETKVGGGIKKPGYYLYGVPQNNINVSNIGAGYAIAAALNISFPEFIQKTLQVFSQEMDRTNYFRILLKGKLTQYFKNLHHLMMVMTRLFLDENLTLAKDIDEFSHTSRFYLWNELFIDISRMCFGKYVIILDDISIDVTGTSIKASKVTDNIDIILPEKVIHIDDIIPTCSISFPNGKEKEKEKTCERSQRFSIEYILLLRKKKKAKSFFSPNKLYYPIFIFIPQVFFKTLNIEKKIFTYSDEIIKLIRIILVEAFSDQKQQSQIGNTIQQDIDIKIILKFISYLRENKYECYIQQILANSKQMCYALVLECDIVGNKSPTKKERKKDELFYFPVKLSYFDNIPNHYFMPIDKESASPEKYVSYEPFQRDKLADFVTLKNIIEEYNTFIVEESEKQGLFRIIEEKKAVSKLNQRENSILPIYPLIKVDYFLLLLSLDGKGLDSKGSHSKESDKLIGFQSQNMFYYFDEMDLTKENLRKLYNSYNGSPTEKTYNLLNRDVDFESIARCIKYLRYDPDKINKVIHQAINKHEFGAPHKAKFYEAVYHKYIYNLFVLEFMSHLDNDRNEEMRQKIAKIISSTDLKNAEAADEMRKKITDLLIDFPDDVMKIQEQINSYFTTHFDKKILLQELSQLVYQYDRTTLLKLQSLSENYNSGDPAHKKGQREALFKFIEKACKGIVQFGEPKFSDDSNISNILVPCIHGSEKAYCSSQKLLVPKDLLDKLIEIFIDDIVNPIKRQYLLSSILISNIQNFFQFEKKEGEEIYVKFN